MTSSSLRDKAENSLHSAIDASQVMLLELNMARDQVKEPAALTWLRKVERRIMEQGELIYAARKEIRELRAEERNFSARVTTRKSR